MESKRQKQVARIIQQYMSEIFIREGKEITENALVTISQVRMTPDLYTARIFLSIYNTEHPDTIMGYIQANSKALRGLLGQKVRHQLRSVPELVFFKDDTLDEVFKLEEIFRQLEAEKKTKENPSEEDSNADNDNQ